MKKTAEVSQKLVCYLKHNLVRDTIIMTQVGQQNKSALY